MTKDKFLSLRPGDVVQAAFGGWTKGGRVDVINLQRGEILIEYEVRGGEIREAWRRFEGVTFVRRCLGK
jgi:hypothetical protein